MADVREVIDAIEKPSPEHFAYAHYRRWNPDGSPEDFARQWIAMARRLPDERKPIAPPVWSYQVTWSCDCHNESRLLVGMSQDSLLSSEEASGFADREDALNAAKYLIQQHNQRRLLFGYHMGKETWVVRATKPGVPEDDLLEIFTIEKTWTRQRVTP